jgi:hypothetical protein
MGFATNECTAALAVRDRELKIVNAKTSDIFAEDLPRSSI